MLFQKKKRSVPQLNASSTADISFVLLILFLVTTSMDVDKGLHRQLPPLQPTKDQQKPQEVDKSRIMTLHIDSRNNLTCNGAKVAIGSLRQKIVDFITVAGPQQHIIRLEADPRHLLSDTKRDRQRLPRLAQPRGTTPLRHQFRTLFRGREGHRQRRLPPAPG